MIYNPNLKVYFIIHMKNFLYQYLCLKLCCLSEIFCQNDYYFFKIISFVSNFHFELQNYSYYCIDFNITMNNYSQVIILDYVGHNF